MLIKYLISTTITINYCTQSLCCTQYAVDIFIFPDLTDKSSFERAKFWVNELKTYEDVSIGIAFILYSIIIFLTEILTIL